jgi:hypothetical protein
VIDPVLREFPSCRPTASACLSTRPADSRSAGRRRHGPHRPQDHRRHVRRHGAARRRGLLRQGPDEGRPVGGVHGALRREERRRGRPRRPVPAARSPTRSARRIRSR